MGIKFDKIEPIAMGNSFPLYAVNSSQSGTCSLCIHNQNESVEKQKHHSVIVDVAGETHVDQAGSIGQLIGLMMHGSKKVSSKFGVYTFLVFCEC